MSGLAQKVFGSQGREYQSSNGTRVHREWLCCVAIDVLEVQTITTRCFSQIHELRQEEMPHNTVTMYNRIMF
jgi:hypothetical protein